MDRIDVFEVIMNVMCVINKTAVKRLTLHKTQPPYCLNVSVAFLDTLVCCRLKRPVSAQTGPLSRSQDGCCG